VRTTRKLMLTEAGRPAESDPAARGHQRTWITRAGLDQDMVMIPPMTLRQAAPPGAPLVHRDALGNVCLDLHFGDVEKVCAAFAEATHVRWLSLRSNRFIVCPTEPCGAIDEYNAEQDRLILRLGCQGVFGQRSLLCSVMGVPVEKLHVRTGNVGGSFGMKASAFPENICLLHAARTLGEPVKWIDERSESFMSDSHGRDHEMLAELALDVGGKLRASQVTATSGRGSATRRRSRRR
jgi:aerobic carbon-monoxide dehydrogenase large subunit